MIMLYSFFICIHVIINVYSLFLFILVSISRFNIPVLTNPKITLQVKWDFGIWMHNVHVKK